MPARIVMVHDDEAFVAAAVSTSKERGTMLPRSSTRWPHGTRG